MNQTRDARHRALDIIEEFQKRAGRLNDDSLLVAIVACVGQVQELRRRLGDHQLLSGQDVELLHTLTRVLELLDRATGPINRAVELLSPYVEVDQEQPDLREPQEAEETIQNERHSAFERLWILRR
jgi:hypothetical protein